MANVERIKFIARKRTSLKIQLTAIQNILDKGQFENLTVKARLEKVQELYRNYEELDDELAIASPDHPDLTEFPVLQDKYFTIIGCVEAILNPNAASTSMNYSITDQNTNVRETMSSEFFNTGVTLPKLTLPNFNGKYEDWLSFKNAFTAMIDKQPNLSNIAKLQYLKSALTGDAANKIKVFELQDESYDKAWDLLERSYGIKRRLINKHLAMLTGLSVQRDENSQGLDKLADDVQQHAATLKSLGVIVPSEMLVHLVEIKLHRKTAEKWELSLKRDEVPGIEQMCDFLYQMAVCVSKRKRTDSNNQEQVKTKDLPPEKRGRLDRPNHSFITNTTKNCVLCKNIYHPLYQCEKFKALSISRRVEVVKQAKLCYNCMKDHRGSPCKFSTCTICGKKHNTMLHFNRENNIKSAKITENKTT